MLYCIASAAAHPDHTVTITWSYGVTATVDLLPAALFAEIERAAAEDDRPAANIVNELIEHGLSERRWRVHVEQARQEALALGLPQDDPPLTDAYRQTIREKITQGLQSVRQGKFVDGEAFFAEIYDELDELDQQDR